MALHLEHSVETAADQELKQRIVGALARLHFPAFRRLHVDVRQGVVTLHGRLGTYYEKQVGEIYIRRVPGVKQLVSRVEVEEKSSSQAAPAARHAPRLHAAAGRNDRAAGGWALVGGAAALALLIVVVVLPAHWKGSRRPALAPLTGRVSFEGQPAVGATVIFHPLEAAAGAPRPTATVGVDGSFALGTFQPGDGAPAGEYAVTVEWRKLVTDGDGDFAPGPNLVPPDYTSADKTPLRAQVLVANNASPSFDIVGQPR